MCFGFFDIFLFFCLGLVRFCAMYKILRLKQENLDIEKLSSWSGREYRGFFFEILPESKEGAFLLCPRRGSTGSSLDWYLLA